MSIRICPAPAKRWRCSVRNTAAIISAAAANAGSATYVERATGSRRPLPVRHHVDVLSFLGGRPKALVCDSSLNSHLTSSIPARRNSASGRKTFGISRDPFPKSIDHIDGGRAAQQSCANLDDRVDLFAHHEIGFVLCVDAATRKLYDT